MILGNMESEREVKGEKALIKLAGNYHACPFWAAADGGAWDPVREWQGRVPVTPSVQ